MSSVFARSWARAASSILDAAMARYAASWPTEDTKWLAANRARTAFVSPGARRPSLVFHQIGVDDDPSQVGDESFDVAIATEVIEHLVRPRNLLRFAKQLLRPGGHLIIITPYHGYLKNLALALTNKWDSHLMPLWDDGHIKLWSHKTLSHVLKEGGFRLVRFNGAGRIPLLWKSMIMVAQKPEELGQ
jgi:SAM-dependent methyltransferase